MMEEEEGGVSVYKNRGDPGRTRDGVDAREAEEGYKREKREGGLRKHK